MSCLQHPECAGRNPVIKVQSYPGPLPGDIGPDGKPLTLHLLPFSKEALAQAMAIEEPENPPDYPIKTMALLKEEAPKAVTIGQFYEALDKFLETLPANAWTPNRNQIVDDQFFPGQLFAIHGYADAHKAITQIVSEGEGTNQGTTYDPLDFQGQPAHYFRFGEIYNERVLTKDPGSRLGFAWGPKRFEVAWPAPGQVIADPGLHDFSKEPQAARDAQSWCNSAFSSMIDALQRAIIGTQGALGEAVRFMFDLRMAALHAFSVPLNTGQFGGPAFLYVTPKAGGQE